MHADLGAKLMFRYALTPLFLGLLLVSLPDAQSQPRPLAQIAAVVNGDLIFVNEVSQALREAYPNENLDELPPTQLNDLRRRMLNNLIDSRLLVQEVKESMSADMKREVERRVETMTQEAMEQLKRQLGSPERMAQYEEQTGLSWQQIRQLRYRNTYENYLRNVVAPQMKRSEVPLPSEEEVEQYIAEEGDVNEEIRVAHILLEVSEDAPVQVENSVAEQAEQLALRARTGEDFGRLVRNHSDHQETIQRGGILPVFQKGELFEEFDVLFEKEVNSVSVIRTPRGYHVVKVIDKATPRQQLWQERYEEMLQEWLQELREEAEIEIRFPELTAQAQVQ